MTDNLPGVQWVPSNGTDGMSFIEKHCVPCGRDRPTSDGVGFEECLDSEICPILSASFRDDAIEWRQLESGETICTEYGKPAVNKNQEQLI
jgi:predicted nucleic acid-binding Zn ribbon protein